MDGPFARGPGRSRESRDFGPTLSAETLEERHGLSVSRQTPQDHVRVAIPWRAPPREPSEARCPAGRVLRAARRPACRLVAEPRGPPPRRFGRRRHDDTERPHGPRLQVAGAEALIPTAPGRAPERPRSAATLAPDAEAHLNRRSTWATGWGQITRGAHDRRSVAVPNCRTGIFSLRAYGALFKL